MRNLRADRHAKHRLDRVLPDAGEIGKAHIEGSARRLERFAFGDRSGDDAAGDLGSDLVHIAAVASSIRWSLVIVEQLEVREMRSRQRDEEAERVLDKRLDALVTVQIEQTVIKRSMGGDCMASEPREAVDRRRAGVIAAELLEVVSSAPCGSVWSDAAFE